MCACCIILMCLGGLYVVAGGTTIWFWCSLGRLDDPDISTKEEIQ